MPKILLYIILIVPAIILGIGISIYVFQERLIFNPEKLSGKHKFVFEVPFEELAYETKDGSVINVLLFKAENSKGVIYYHHGNAGNLDSWGIRAIDFTSRGYDVLMYDYRGYGKSSGSIKNEKMLYNDALMIYNKLLKDYGEEDIIIYGVSLGTGIAAELANSNVSKMLVLETPYYNFYDVSKFHYPYLPNSILLNYHFRTNKILPKIESPIFLVHGTEDETVPYNSSIRLEKLSENIQLFTVEEGSHNNLRAFDEYQRWLSEILL